MTQMEMYFLQNISGKGFDDGIAIKLDKNENIFIG